MTPPDFLYDKLIFIVPFKHFTPQVSLRASGSDGSAACGGKSDLSEWPRSIADEGALSPRKISGTATEPGVGIRIPKSLLLEEKVAERKRGRMRCKTVGYSNNTSSVTFGDSFSSRRSLRERIATSPIRAPRNDMLFGRLFEN